MKSFDEIISKNVKKEFEKFKQEQISRLPITVFENAGKIHFYNEIFTYIQNNTLGDIFNANELKALAECKTKLISLMYDEYCSKENLSITNWEAIQEIFESYLK